MLSKQLTREVRHTVLRPMFGPMFGHTRRASVLALNCGVPVGPKARHLATREPSRRAEGDAASSKRWCPVQALLSIR